ncbi:MAG: glycosyltransferase family 2 protein [Cytophagales bacterium]|nr:glycosyltransferase family 2 protein [Cytophagales bacterium]
MKYLSIVIPTLNEAANLRNTILHTQAMCADVSQLEIIVVDNGSVDHTLETVKDLEVKTFEQPSLKGKKYAVLNFGLRQAAGEVIMFLDADTQLPESFDLLIKKSLSDPRVVGGAFDFEFQERQWYLQALAALNRLRIRVDYNFLGDQAVFCRRSILEQIGGYPEKLIMESSYLCLALREHGRLKIVPSRIRTSARRFLENGFLKVFWYDSKVWFHYLLGLDTDRFGAAYWQHNDTTLE